ncbi:phytanoyl-CoA dioxygenase family protein [Coemansia spiralis]|nr:phytanoyl-CoA dioxygenase family protein [Coemansia spiralis]
MELSDSKLEQFAQDGYVVIEEFLTPLEVEALRTRTAKLLTEFDPTTHKVVAFDTGLDDKHISDQYFLDSADKIHYFLEPTALLADDELVVNKIGHGLHIVDPVFSAVTHSDKFRQLTQRLNYADARVLQSMVILKQPKVGGAVPMHQDSSFLFTKPLSALGFWLALDKCTMANGCLEVLRGSSGEPITKRFVRSQGKTEMVDIEPTGGTKGAAAAAAEGECVPVEVGAGALVLIHGQVLHRSAHNHSDQPRWAYTFHVVDGTCEYDERNWLQMPELTKL